LESNTPTSISDDGRKVYPFVIFGVTVTAILMGALDQSIVATALPTLRHSLHAQLNWAGWTITAYQFGLVMALPVAGRISDQFGRRRIFLVCLVIFTSFSLLCAIASNIYELVAFRAIQALGGGAFMPSAIGIIADHFGKNRDRAIGMISSTVPIGSLAGPLLGGVIVAYWSWRGIFLINVPIGIIIFILTLRYVPRSRPIDAPKADIRGVTLLAGVIVPLMYGITTLGDGTTSVWSPQFIVPELLAVACGYLFVRHARVAIAPVIPLRLLRSGGFGTLNIINYLYGGCALGIGALIPLYAEERYHFGSLEAGTVLATRAVGVLVIAATTSFLIRRIGYRRPMIVGFSVAALGMVVLALGPRGLSTYAWLAIGAALMGLGNGIAAPATNNAVLHRAIGEAGSISGIRGMFRQFGAISAISVTTAIVSRSHNEGLALSHVFFILAIVVTAIVVPLTFTVADHRGSW
jgi:EmrB/QacA subfamily drug resistance transporter